MKADQGDVKSVIAALENALAPTAPKVLDVRRYDSKEYLTLFFKELGLRGY
jgi:hypothetical protein